MLSFVRECANAIFSRNRPYSYDAWKQRVERETSGLREAFLSARLEDGSKVVEVGDLVWWPYIDRYQTYVLAGVRLDTGRCLALGYVNGAFVEPLDSTGKAWAFNNCTIPPSLEHDDDAILVSVTPELGLMAMFGSEYGTNASPRTWRYEGICHSGDAAIRKFAEHGFSIEFSEN